MRELQSMSEDAFAHIKVDGIVWNLNKVDICFLACLATYFHHSL